MTSFFLEIVIAPSFTEEAIEVFTKKKNLRVIEYKELGINNKKTEIREVFGGIYFRKKIYLYMIA